MLLLVNYIPKKLNVFLSFDLSHFQFFIWMHFLPSIKNLLHFTYFVTFIIISQLIFIHSIKFQIFNFLYIILLFLGPKELLKISTLFSPNFTHLKMQKIILQLKYILKQFFPNYQLFLLHFIIK